MDIFQFCALMILIGIGMLYITIGLYAIKMAIEKVQFYLKALAHLFKKYQSKDKDF